MKIKHFVVLISIFFMLIPSGLHAQNKLLDDQIDTLTRFFFSQVPMSRSFVMAGKSALFAVLVTVNQSGTVTSIKLSENTPQEFKDNLLKLKQANVKWSAFLRGQPPRKKYDLLLTIYTIIDAVYFGFAAPENGLDPSYYFGQIYNFNGAKYDLSSAIFVPPFIKSAWNKKIDESMPLDTNDIYRPDKVHLPVFPSVIK